MLRYLALGERNLSRVPDTESQRLNWEFYVLFEGKCWPQFSDKTIDNDVRDANFWITRPLLTYRWRGDNQPYQRAVLQFSSVPNEFEAAMPESGVIAVKLSEQELERAKQVAQNVVADYAEPNEFSSLVFDHAMLDLILLAIRHLPEVGRTIHFFEDRASDRVEQAVRYYMLNLRRNPKMSEISEVVHVSTSQLRRLFLQARMQSPLEYLRKMRMKRIAEHLATTDDTLESIAKAYSFCNSTDLCRTFKAVFGVSPLVWRKNYAISGRTPKDVYLPSNLGMLIVPPRMPGSHPSKAKSL